MLNLNLLLGKKALSEAEKAFNMLVKKYNFLSLEGLENMMIFFDPMDQEVSEVASLISSAFELGMLEINSFGNKVMFPLAADHILFAKGSQFMWDSLVSRAKHARKFCIFAPKHLENLPYLRHFCQEAGVEMGELKLSKKREVEFQKMDEPWKRSDS